VVIVLAGVLTWQGLVAHRHQAARAEAERDAQWTTTYQQASQAFGGGNYPEAERILLIHSSERRKVISPKPPLGRCTGHARQILPRRPRGLQ